MIGLDLTPGSVAQAIGSAVLHFLWQGAAVGVLAALALGVVKRTNASARHLICCAAMTLCLVCFASTAVSGLVADGAPARSDGAIAPGTTAAAVPALEGAAPDPAGLLSAVAWLWTGGVVFFGVRFGTQWAAAVRLRGHGADAPDDAWVCVFEDLKSRLGIRSNVQLLRSSLAQVPMVVGWLSPVVIVPASAFASLTPDQLRAVLAHELAHIRRHDHLFNAAQAAAEALLFFHPVTWWLSATIRTEREHCCDDTTICTTANARVFAQALARLELMRSDTPQAALAATGGPLMDRIARILGTSSTTPRAPMWRGAAAIAAGAAVAAAGLAHAASKDQHASDADELIMTLRQYAEVADPDNQQLRDVYNMFVFRGSDSERAMERELAEVAVRLEASVERGDITRGAAAAKLAEIQDSLDDKVDAVYLMQVFRYTEAAAYLRVARRNLADAVRAGEITRADADAKLAAMNRKHEARVSADETIEMMSLELRAALAAGTLSENQAREKMTELERSLQLRSELAVLEQRLAKAAGAGEPTPAELLERLESLRARMSATREIDWDAVKTRVEGAVERGELTRDEADEIYKGVHERASSAQHDQAGDEVKTRRVVEALAASGIERNKLDAATVAVEKLAAEFKAKGHASGLSKDITGWLESDGYSDDQIKIITDLAARLVESGRAGR